MAEEEKTDESLEQLRELEQKVLRALEVCRQAGAERDELRRQVTELRRKLVEQDQALREMQNRVKRLERERESVKLRVQKMLEQVDSLAAGPEG